MRTGIRNRLLLGFDMKPLVNQSPRFMEDSIQALQQTIEGKERQLADLRAVIDRMRVDMVRKDRLMDSLREELQRIMKDND